MWQETAEKNLEEAKVEFSTFRTREMAEVAASPEGAEVLLAGLSKDILDDPQCQIEVAKVRDAAASLQLLRRREKEAKEAKEAKSAKEEKMAVDKEAGHGDGRENYGPAPRSSSLARSDPHKQHEYVAPSQ
eukprot:1964016-Prorocentrum_lima.AAC.1